MESGEIDMYWEYLGTGWINILGETGNIPEPAYETVAERDLEENNIHWFEPAPEENSYVIATNRETADTYGLSTLSDLESFIAENPDEASICVGSEFAVRDDGLPGLQEPTGTSSPMSSAFRMASSTTRSPTARGATSARSSRRMDASQIWTSCSSKTTRSSSQRSTAR